MMDEKMKRVLRIFENEHCLHSTEMSSLSDDQLKRIGAFMMRSLGNRIGLEQAMETIFATALSKKHSIGLHFDLDDDDLAAGESDED